MTACLARPLSFHVTDGIPGGERMLASLQQSLPAQWQDTFHFLVSGFTWILDFASAALGFVFSGPNPAIIVVKSALILLPCALLIAGLWCTMASLYTLPFRSGRGAFLTALLVSWWDAGRMTWFYWAVLVRVGLLLL